MRAMMEGAIDYAGLFPPAALDMVTAVRNFDAYRAGPNAWMLGRFIVPSTRLDELVACRPFAAGTERRLSVIASAADAHALAAFNVTHGVRARIDTVETPVVTIADIGALGALAREYLVYAEVNIAVDPTPVIVALANAGVRAKARTGGVTPGAIPAVEQVARFIVSCRSAGVAFKMTAGLHHAWRASYPLTYAPDSPRAELYGFMNVMLASAVAASGGTVADVAHALRAGADVAVTAERAILRDGRVITSEAMAQARTSVIASFGSCSFDEPVQELQDRNLL